MNPARLPLKCIGRAEGVLPAVITPFVGYSHTPVKDPLAFHF